MSEDVIQAARAHWSLGDAAITLIAARENSVYRVELQKGAAALRLHRNGYRSRDEILSELMWMDMLAANGLSVPKPVQAPDGTTIKTFNGTVVDLLSWINGTPLSKIEVTEDIYYKLGSLLAQMHRLADEWKTPATFTRPIWDLVGDQPSWGRFWENPFLDARQRKQFYGFRDTAQRALQSMPQSDYGLIHADLVPDNVLSHGKQLNLIDFDDGGFGYRLFDLATITHRHRRLNMSTTLIDATLAGYSAQRGKQRDLELHLLPLFEALRACSYVGWNISRFSEAGAQERNARFIAEAESSLQRFQAGL